MSYTAVHEILYKDELGQTAVITPGSELSKAEEKALAKDLADLVKSKAIKSDKAATPKTGDGFGDK